LPKDDVTPPVTNIYLAELTALYVLTISKNAGKPGKKISTTRGTNVNYNREQKNSVNNNFELLYNPLIRYILISLVLFPFLLHAQENGKKKYDDASESYATFNGSIVLDSVFSFRSPKGFFPSLVNNFAYQATFPVRMKQKHLFMLAGVTVVTLTLINYDQQIDNYFKPVKENGTVSSSVSPYITELGDYYGYLLLAGYGCYSIGFHKYRAFRTSLLATQAAITAGLWIRIGKTLTGRIRPGATYGDPEYKLDHWFGPFAGYNVNYN
jgi:hypothetical protein